jgi:hypothetical protein
MSACTNARTDLFLRTASSFSSLQRGHHRFAALFRLSQLASARLPGLSNPKVAGSIPARPTRFAPKRPSGLIFPRKLYAFPHCAGAADAHAFRPLRRNVSHEQVGSLVRVVRD